MEHFVSRKLAFQVPPVRRIDGPASLADSVLRQGLILDVRIVVVFDVTPSTAEGSIIVQ